MIFYESIVTRVKPMRDSVPAIHATEADARKAFNAAKRQLKKSGDAGQMCAHYKVEANTILTKEIWMMLFLGDHIGSHNCPETDVLFIRDLLTSRKCLGSYKHDSC